MVVTYTPDGTKIYLDGYLKSNIDIIKKNVTELSDDFVCLITGKTSTGKSTIAMQLAKYMDNNFNINNVCWNPKKFVDLCLDLPSFSSIILDEGMSCFTSRRSHSKINSYLIDLLSRIRERNLFIFIIAPNFFEVDKRLSVFRSHCMLKTYVSKKNEKGSFCFYSYKSKGHLFTVGRGDMVWHKTNPNFYGGFTKNFVINHDDYLKRKEEALFSNFRASDIYEQLKKKEEQWIQNKQRENKKLNETVTSSQIGEIKKEGDVKPFEVITVEKIFVQPKHPCPQCKQALRNRGTIKRKSGRVRKYVCATCHTSFYEKVNAPVEESKSVKETLATAPTIIPAPNMQTTQPNDTANTTL